MIAGKTRIVYESKKEFESILKADLSEKDKLNELVKLRNYLKETYIMSGKYEEFPRPLKEIENLIAEIDAHWWKVFTKGD